MRRFLTTIVIIIIAVTALLATAWTFRSHVAAFYLSRALNHAPVSIAKLDYQNLSWQINNLNIANLNAPKTTAFSAAKIAIYAKWSDLLGSKTIVDAMEASHLAINIEHNKNGTTNWSKILEQKQPKEKTSSKTNYLIKEIQLRKIQVTVTDQTGKVTRYPVIKNITLYDVSSEKGLPIGDLQKVIFQLILNKILQEYGIKGIEETIKDLIPTPNHFPFFSK